MKVQQIPKSEEQGCRAPGWCAQRTGCKRSVAATCLPAKFMLAVVSGKFKGYLCCYLFLFWPSLETTVLSFWCQDVKNTMVDAAEKGRMSVLVSLMWLMCSKGKLQPIKGFFFWTLFDGTSCWKLATELWEWKMWQSKYVKRRCIVPSVWAQLKGC